MTCLFVFSFLPSFSPRREFLVTQQMGIIILLIENTWLRVPWTARSSNQSILKETNPEYSLEGLMLKLKLRYFGHLMWRTNSLEKTLMLGKIEGWRRRGWQRMRWMWIITDSVDVNLSKLGDSEGQRSLRAAVHGVTVSQIDLVIEQQQLTFSFNSKYFLVLLILTKQQPPPNQGFAGRVIHISKKNHICLACRSSALDYLSQKPLLRIFLRRWWNFGWVGRGRGIMFKREMRGEREQSRRVL